MARAPRFKVKLIIAPVFLALALVGTLGSSLHAQNSAPGAAPASDPEPSSRAWEHILPAATNLQVDGAKAKAAKKPILLFFNLGGCHYCRFSLRTTVVPMFRDPKWRDAIEFRQITVDDGKSLVDFDGARINNDRFAKVRRGDFTPTVMMVDGDGKQLGEAIVGIANADYYNYNVESLVQAAIDEARKR